MLQAHSGDFELSTLTALSPLDGRYRQKMQELTPLMSEYGLNYFRVIVEVHPFLFSHSLMTLLLKVLFSFF
ncbi:adenylosuccinate lyase, putative [Medicago truncatula]|uniref:Adenylosuccinate lyase, putative n=1 Tax=Medicago truncatula TaxID=3880 RepID=A2Q4T2_MEDTR|nr:hypothetical protein MtrDRAFT_AC157891g16v2 [Medicago truncatula]AES81444.1 adenylosuccinate lyase, putative [Medicago truncatula]